MASPDAPLELHPDRLLPPDPDVGAIARRLYDEVDELPIVYLVSRRPQEMFEL